MEEFFEAVTRDEAEGLIESGSHFVVLRPSSISYRYPNVYAVSYRCGGRICHSLARRHTDSEKWNLVDLGPYENAIDTDFTFENGLKMIAHFMSLSGDDKLRSKYIA